MLGMTMYAHLYMVKISNQGLRLKIVCLSDSEFTIFSNPRIRNLWRYTPTKTRTSSLPKKACQKGKLLLPLPAKEPFGGGSGRGFKGEPVGDIRKVPLGSPLLRSGHVHDQNSLKYKAIISLKVKEKLFLLKFFLKYPHSPQYGNYTYSYVSEDC